MSRTPDYRCSSCGNEYARHELTVKKSVFLEMGEGARTIRSRVTGWLCGGCLREDSDYNRQPQVQRKVVKVNG